MQNKLAPIHCIRISLVLCILLTTTLAIVPVSTAFEKSSFAISYVTYFGGSNIEEVSTTACRADGAIAMVGHSNSPNLPVSDSAFQQEFRGGEWDAFVTMYDSTGTMVLCTYLGGSAREHVDGVAFDNSGNIVVVGNTISDDFPVTSDAFQSERAGEYDGFIATISDNGTLLYGSYFGGNSSDSIEYVTVDHEGNYLFGGTTSSVDLATEGAYQTQPRGGNDVYVAELARNGSRILLFTYVGGSTYDRMDSMTVDSSFNFIISGMTRSDDFPTTSDAFQRNYAGAGDVFLAKIENTGSELYWSTYIGGSAEEYGRGVGVDSSDNIVVTGPVQSADIETYNAIQPEYGGGACDTLVGLFSSDGDVISLSYLGGDDLDLAYDAEFDTSDRIIISGRTLSDDYPLVEPMQSNRTGHIDLTVTILSTNAESIVMSTFFGGTKEDSGESVSISSDGNIVITGRTASDDLSCTDNAQQNTIGGSYDAFLLILSSDAAMVPLEFHVIILGGLIGLTLILVMILKWKKDR